MIEEDKEMATCTVCGKQRVIGNNVSHANNRTKRLCVAEPSENAHRHRKRREEGLCMHKVSPLRRR